MSFLFNEAEVFAETKAKDETVTPVAAHKRHKKHEYTLENIPEGMPTRQVEHRLEGEDLVCPECGAAMTWLYRTGGDTDKPIVLHEYEAQSIRRNS